MSAATGEHSAGVNLAVVFGQLSSDPKSRSLPSGDEIVTYEVTVRHADGPAESVPVVVVAGRTPKSLRSGDEIVVTGRVRRRFFRAGGVTASRTEVVAERVVRPRRPSQVVAELERAGRVLAACHDGPGADEP
jgi:single-strand DNA-binding protein